MRKLSQNYKTTYSQFNVVRFCKCNSDRLLVKDNKSVTQQNAEQHHLPTIPCCPFLSGCPGVKSVLLTAPGCCGCCGVDWACGRGPGVGAGPGVLMATAGVWLTGAPGLATDLCLSSRKWPRFFTFVFCKQGYTIRFKSHLSKMKSWPKTDESIIVQRSCSVQTVLGTSPQS